MWAAIWSARQVVDAPSRGEDLVRWPVRGGARLWYYAGVKSRIATRGARGPAGATANDRLSVSGEIRRPEGTSGRLELVARRSGLGPNSGRGRGAVRADLPRELHQASAASAELAQTGVTGGADLPVALGLASATRA
jgi:hypothetical protein